MKRHRFCMHRVPFIKLDGISHELIFVKCAFQGRVISTRQGDDHCDLFHKYLVIYAFTDTDTFLTALSLSAPYEVNKNEIEANKALLNLANKEFLSNGNRTRSVLRFDLACCSPLKSNPPKNAMHGLLGGWFNNDQRLVKGRVVGWRGRGHAEHRAQYRQKSANTAMTRKNAEHTTIS